MDEDALREKARELIMLKRQIEELRIKEKELKGELLPLIKEHGGAVNFDFGRVYYGTLKGAQSFSRKTVLQYLRETYGDALAEQVDRTCTKHNEPRENLYVRIHEIHDL